jgi:hypothetical protein
MTLIEVVAGLALMATLLVALLQAKVGHARQANIADRKMAAVGAADRLLTYWWSHPEGFPAESAGKVPGDPRFAWRTGLVPNESAEEMQLDVVRLEIVDLQAKSQDPIVLAAVDVVISNAAPEAPTQLADTP